jgi:hypothetical protein
MKHLLLPLLLLTLPSPAASGPRSSAGQEQMPGRENPEQSWRLSGAGHFRYRLFSVFNGALYLGGDVPGSQRLQLTYTRSIPAQTLAEQGLRVLRQSYSADEIAARNGLLEQINQAYRDVRAGDMYSFTVIPGQGTWLHLNGEELLFVHDSDFGLWYLGIWLGEHPMSASLRDALLPGENL